MVAVSSILLLAFLWHRSREQSLEYVVRVPLGVPRSDRGAEEKESLGPVDRGVPMRDGPMGTEATARTLQKEVRWLKPNLAGQLHF